MRKFVVALLFCSAFVVLAAPDALAKRHAETFVITTVDGDRIVEATARSGRPPSWTRCDYFEVGEFGNHGEYLGFYQEDAFYVDRVAFCSAHYADRVGG